MCIAKSKGKPFYILSLRPLALGRFFSGHFCMLIVEKICGLWGMVRVLLLLWKTVWKNLILASMGLGLYKDTILFFTRFMIASSIESSFSSSSFYTLPNSLFQLIQASHSRNGIHLRKNRVDLTFAMRVLITCHPSSHFKSSIAFFGMGEHGIQEWDEDSQRMKGRYGS